MNLIRTILSHSVLLIVGAFAGYIYLNRTEVLPEWFPPDSVPAMAAAEQTVAAPEPVTATPDAAAIPAPAPEVGTAVSASSGAAKDETAVAETPATTGAPPDRASLHRHARAAFWKKDYESAVSSYKALLGTDAGNSADIHGELGNLYYMAGRWEDAGASYYEAAVRLLDRGERDRAHYLYKVIQGLDPKRAALLGKRLGVAS